MLAPIPAEQLSPSEFEEACRLDRLEKLDILDSPREEAFDRFVSLAKAVFQVPISYIALLDAHRQWHKAESGLDVEEVPRNISFCRYVVDDPQMLIVPDTLLDPRFAQSIFVTAAPFVRFYAGAPLTTSDGFTVGSLCIIDTRPRVFSQAQANMLGDMAFLIARMLELRETASTDLLTGTMSRRAFTDIGEKGWASAQRRGQPLSCVTFDIDHFKKINDKFGHAAGDAVLKGVADGVKSVLQKSDLFGRLGGEEFAIMLTQTDRRAAMTVAERLRTHIEQLEFRLGAERQKVTASFGVAMMDESTRDLQSLLANADAALYKAKAGGRNMTVAWDMPDEKPVAAAPVEEPRRRVLKGGRILFNNKSTTVDCTIRSLSSKSAGIDVLSSDGLPDRFTLLIPVDGMEVQCKVTGIAPKHLEVQFA